MKRLSRWMLGCGLILSVSGCAGGYYDGAVVGGGYGYAAPAYGYGGPSYAYGAPGYVAPGYVAPAYGYAAPRYGYAPRYSAPLVQNYVQSRQYDRRGPRGPYAVQQAPSYAPRGPAQAFNPPARGYRPPTVSGREYSRNYLQQRPGGSEVGTGN